MIITRLQTDDIIVDENGNHLYEIRDILTLPASALDREYSVQEGDTLKDIAFKQYRAEFGEHATRLWWILAEFNNIIDPFESLTVGTILKYPSARKINEELL